MKLSENMKLWHDLETEIDTLEAHRSVDIVQLDGDFYLRIRPGAVGAAVSLVLKILDAYHAAYGDKRAEEAGNDVG